MLVFRFGTPITIDKCQMSCGSTVTRDMQANT